MSVRTTKGREEDMSITTEAPTPLSTEVERMFSRVRIPHLRVTEQQVWVPFGAGTLVVLTRNHRTGKGVDFRFLDAGAVEIARNPKMSLGAMYETIARLHGLEF